MMTHLLCMKEGMSSVDEKITKKGIISCGLI